MSKLKITAVSYLNTKPFIYGIKNCLNENDFELQLLPPAQCAQAIIEQKADIGLIPVAAIPLLSDYNIITDYCIGSERKVESVCLYSNVPLNEITSISLDFESKTSVNLVKVLAKNHWKITPTWKPASKDFELNINGTEGAVVIGDKTFGLTEKYNYTYDLAEEWFNYTGLPFVFACWVGKKDLPDEKIALLNNALNFGVNNIDFSVKEFDNLFGQLIDINNYFRNCISYEFNQGKKQGMDLFLKLLKENQQQHGKLLPIN